MYNIEITEETPNSIHFRVLCGDTEVYAGGVDRAEYDEYRRDTSYAKEATLFEFAKARGGLDGALQLPLPVSVDGEPTSLPPHTHPDYLTTHDIDALRDELLITIDALDDGSTQRLRGDLDSHGHSQYLTNVPAHGHAAMEARLGGLEVAVETIGSHSHPMPAHTHPHDHTEFIALNSANVALAQNLRDILRALRDHGHPHGHDDVVSHVEALEGVIGDLELTVVPTEHRCPPHTHASPSIEGLVGYAPLLARVMEMETELAELRKPRKARKAELRVLSREDRGGKHIIIAEEV